MSHHQGLQNVIEDQLSLAAIHFLRTHYQEAIDIYKKILLDNRYNYNAIRTFYMRPLQVLFLFLVQDVSKDHAGGR